jgi:HAD superfamily hydrolase (TIGR01509 family)
MCDIDAALSVEAVLRRADLEPIPGLLDFLDAVRAAGLRQVAVTNSEPENVRLMLQEIGLSTAFEAVIFGADCARAKPHPEPYLEGLRALGGVSPCRALVFEDSPAGVAAGLAAGVRTVALATTQPPAVLADLGASDIVADYVNLLL